MIAHTNKVAVSDLSVAIVCGSLSRAAGGILPIMQAHARELANQGVKVAAFGAADAFSESDAASWAPISPHFFLPQLRGFAYAPDLGRAITDAPVDIVHQHGLWMYPSLATSRWRRRHRRPVVISTQGMLEPWALSNSWAKKKIAAALFERDNLTAAACLH
ncbi:MAG: glycosyltransferase, partial [Pseudomonadota bacterium]